MIEPAPVPATPKGTFGSPFFRSVAVPGEKLRGLDYLLAANAAGADPNPLGGAVHQNPNRLKVGHPAALPPVVGVADMVAGCWALGADGANACHGDTSPLVVLVINQAIKFSPEIGMAQGNLCRGR